MAYYELLRHYPPPDIVAQSDPAYPLFEADGGCRVCASGEACQDRIETDIDDILALAGLSDTARLACLQWLFEQGMSSLTHSIEAMAEEFQELRRV
jgi:hypothetical protein